MIARSQVALEHLSLAAALSCLATGAYLNEGRLRLMAGIAFGFWGLLLLFRFVPGVHERFLAYMERRYFQLAHAGLSAGSAEPSIDPPALPSERAPAHKPVTWDWSHPLGEFQAAPQTTRVAASEFTNAMRSLFASVSG